MAQSESIDDILDILELEERARIAMPRTAYEYIRSGAGEENTVRWNREAYDKVALKPRALRDVAAIDTSIELLGEKMALPILLAPVAYHRTLHVDGEIATAKGASAAHATLVISSGTNTSIEDIARVATCPLWFQLYLQSDRAFTREVIERVEAAGVKAICLTVDSPPPAPRNRQTKSSVRLPLGVATHYLADTGKGKQESTNSQRGTVTWKDVGWLKSVTGLPVLLKGVLTPEDAALSVGAGVDGLIVSNHGGRHLDTLPSTLDALPRVVDQCAGAIPVLVDGGIRRGTDVLKALAFGAKAVLIGRAYSYGLSLGGALGVQRVMEILRDELVMAMMLTGRKDLSEIDRSLIWNVDA